MGKSVTIHCLGHAKTFEGNYQLYYAMNRLEIVQSRHRAKKDGLIINYWTAQTKTGERILGSDMPLVPDNMVPSVKVATCPICNGKGANGEYYCPVCNGCGITKPGNWYKRAWQAWQLENMSERSKG